MIARAESRRNTQGKVMATAERLFLERGFTDTTIRDIAAAAGVSVGSVMAAGDKRELLVSIFDGHIAEVHRRRAEEHRPRVKPKTAAAERIMDIVEPFLEFFSQDMDLAREYAAILMSGSHGSVVFEHLAAALLEEIGTALLESGMPAADVPTAAKAVYLSYLGALFASAGAGASDHAHTRRELRAVFTLIAQSGADRK